MAAVWALDLSAGAGEFVERLLGYQNPVTFATRRMPAAAATSTRVVVNP